MTFRQSHHPQLNGNRMSKQLHIIRICLFLTAMFSMQPLLCQQQDQLKQVKVKGEHYYVYYIVPGSTLYSISKKYAVPVSILKEINPHANQSLSLGDSLLIPVEKKDKEARRQKLELDGNIIVHEVEKGQTIYSISKLYELEVKDIVVENPEVRDGLSIGQLLRIPVAKIKEGDGPSDMSDEAYEVMDNPFLTHRVEKGQTLYSLSRLYNVSPDSIKQVNGGLPEGLKTGASIYIPIIVEKQDSTDKEIAKSVFKEKYTVAYFLPFYLDLNDTLEARRTITEPENYLKKSQFALFFYQGIYMALDSMKNLGLSLNVKIFDTAKDTNKVKEILSSGALDDVDLVVGPLYFSCFQQVAEYVRDKPIQIICPVNLSNRILLGNESVCKVASSQNIQIQYLADYVVKNHRYDNLLIIRKSIYSNNLADTYKKRYRQGIQMLEDTLIKSPLIEVYWDRKDISPVKRVLHDTTKRNVIFIPSDDQAYVTDLLRQLNGLHDDYEIMVIGISDWLKYKNIDLNYFENLDLHLALANDFNQSAEEYSTMNKKYFELFESYPNKFSYMGFDITMYFEEMLRKYGNNFAPHFDELTGDLTYYRFNLKKTGAESGYENHAFTLVKFEDYDFKTVYKLPLNSTSNQ